METLARIRTAGLALLLLFTVVGVLASFPQSALASVSSEARTADCIWIWDIWTGTWICILGDTLPEPTVALPTAQVRPTVKNPLPATKTPVPPPTATVPAATGTARPKETCPANADCFRDDNGEVIVESPRPEPTAVPQQPTAKPAPQAEAEPAQTAAPAEQPSQDDAPRTIDDSAATENNPNEAAVEKSFHAPPGGIDALEQQEADASARAAEAADATAEAKKVRDRAKQTYYQRCKNADGSSKQGLSPAEAAICAAAQATYIEADAAYSRYIQYEIQLERLAGEAAKKRLFWQDVLAASVRYRLDCSRSQIVNGTGVGCAAKLRNVKTRMSEWIRNY